jgi:pyruvate formate lyase activating enzyme
MKGLVQCQLCPKACRIAPGQSGECRIRINVDGRLLAVTHGFPCAVHVDPIEKKPLFHFLPGTPIFSIATAGCNLHCKNCQNWEISQANPEDIQAYDLPPDKVVEVARARGCTSIAYTYTEPLVYYEYALEASTRAREAGLRNVLVTAGYVNPAPARRLFEVTDAANIDLKAMDDGFYRDVCSATLGPVLDTLVLAREMGVWVEVTNLVIPTLNDEPAMIRKLARWVVDNLGADTPVHFSRFSPRFKMQNLPPTPESTLLEARAEAQDAGVRHVYIGNVPGSEGETTFCPEDGTRLIRRIGFTVESSALKDGCCPGCGTPVAGVWE